MSTRCKTASLASEFKAQVVMDSDSIDLAGMLDLAVMTPVDLNKATFRVIGDLPQWWPDELGKSDVSDIRITAPYLIEFLLEARKVWDSSDDCVLKSDLFELNSNSPMQALVAKQGPRKSLVIRNLSATDGWMTAVLQKARSNLVNQEYERSGHRKEVASIRADRDEAKRREELKSRVLANMSHEIRTPLATILGMVDLAKSKKDCKKQLEAISIAAEQLLRLGNDILDLSKMQVARLELDDQPIDLTSFLKSLKSEWTLHAEDKGLTFDTQFDVGLPPRVKADEFRLRQVLANLLGNAIKFTDKGTVHFSVAPVNATRIRFTVHDTGSGIAEADLPFIFEAFSQVDSSKRRRHQGAGLGLAIANRLVNLMDGEIKVESQAGLGTKFWFDIVLPRIDEVIGSEEVVPLSDNCLSGCAILVAEDHLMNRTILIEVLESAGADVVAVINGKEAITQWQSRDFDLIIMDCQMPVMDGMKAISTIRGAASGVVQIPIVALTAHSMKSELDKVMRCGASVCVTKPYEAPALVRAVRHLIQKSEATTKA